ncbi:hypothetical protein [Cohnella hongkongensis]|uniref:Uncharacterized protein n=1 Tax=Cohnella hongkongensis TaxID=178337 RepID=A0ABV9FJ61_9BACL
MKKVFSIAISFALIFTLCSTVFAKSSMDGLTSNEIAILKQKGLNDEDIQDYPVEVLKELIALNATLLAKGQKIGYDLVSEGPQNNGGISTNALTTSDITIAGDAWVVTSDWSGYKRIYLTGRYEWKIRPLFEFTDKMSIGYPTSAKFIFRTNNGLINGHTRGFQENICGQSGYGSTMYTYQPSDWQPGAGLAASFNLSPSTPFNTYCLRKGWVSQYVYVNENETGTTNIQIRYGHSVLGLTPAVSVFPAGLAVTPSLNTETIDYALTVTW